MVIAPERLSELIGLIYDCAIDPARWPVAMEAIRLELACHNATLDLVELPSGMLLTTATSNIPATYLPLLAQAGNDVVEQWGGEEKMRSLPLERPAVMSRVNPGFAERMDGNHYYQAFAKPQGLVDVIAIGLARDARAIGALAFGRHESAGPVGEREIAVAQLLLPHLQRVATINRMLERKADERYALQAILDALTVPIVLIDADRRIVHANPAARRLLDEGALIRVAAGRLEAGTAKLTRSLAGAISGFTGGGRYPSRGLDFPVARDGKTGALHLLPLTGTDGRPRSGAGAVAALFISAAPGPSSAATRAAAALFGLTPREVSVFEHLVAGRSQEEAASVLQIERSTLKTHLARIYAKLGVNSQPALITLALSLSIPI